MKRFRGCCVSVCLFPVLLAVSGETNASGPETAIKVSHAPKEPKTGDRVVITVEAPRAQVGDGLTLQYQVVAPGEYIGFQDPAYRESWTRVAFTESAREKSNPSRATFTVELPAGIQKHRRLVRYRVCSPNTDAVLVPSADDTQPNFAYFVYDGIPEWRAAINPKGSEAQREIARFEPEVMRSVQAYHLLSKRSSIENVTWREPKNFTDPSASEYKYTGTLVAGGKVYDHIRFRARGGTWRHAMGKNMWKIDFHQGHHLEARDNWGRKYETKWGKLNLGACIQQGNYGMRGEHGMLEAVAFRLFNLAGVEASHTHWIQLRMIDQAEETPADQYRGDFWGLYLAMENPDGDFLKEHRLPDGNLYKMDFGGPEPAHLVEGGPTDRADVREFMGHLREQPDPEWWTSNVDLPRYYSYRSILECIHHYDVDMGKNYYYFHNPASKRWQVVPWDVDLTWGNHMFGHGAEPFYRAGLLQRDPFKAEYEGRLIEIRDLLFNPEQTGALIDEYASVIAERSGGLTMIDADRAKWDYHPIMSSQYVMPGKSDPGMFYKGSPTRDFAGILQLMKQYVETRGAWVDQTLLADASLPPTPTIAPIDKLDTSAPQLKVQLTPGSLVKKVRWRLAEITGSGDPSTKGKQPVKYEIDALWEAEGGSTARIPTAKLKSGHTYRIRARVQDDNSHWSHWSVPLEFREGER